MKLNDAGPLTLLAYSLYINLSVIFRGNVVERTVFQYTKSNTLLVTSPDILSLSKVSTPDMSLTHVSIDNSTCPFETLTYPYINLSETPTGKENTEGTPNSVIKELTKIFDVPDNETVAVTNPPVDGLSDATL